MEKILAIFLIAKIRWRFLSNTWIALWLCVPFWVSMKLIFWRLSSTLCYSVKLWISKIIKNNCNCVLVQMLFASKRKWTGTLMTKCNFCCAAVPISLVTVLEGKKWWWTCYFFLKIVLCLSLQDAHFSKSYFFFLLKASNAERLCLFIFITLGTAVPEHGD